MRAPRSLRGCCCPRSACGGWPAACWEVPGEHPQVARPPGAACRRGRLRRLDGPRRVAVDRPDRRRRAARRRAPLPHRPADDPRRRTPAGHSRPQGRQVVTLAIPTTPDTATETKTGPANSVTDQVTGSRVYIHPITGERFTSVTTILSIVAKDALPYWAAKVVQEKALDMVPALVQSLRR